MINRISIIGSGNVATHLVRAWHDAGIHIETVWSRNIRNAAKLAAPVGAAYTDRFSNLSPNSELYLICVPDDAIETVYSELMNAGLTDKLMAHTSGSTPASILRKPENGVIYPLQSFSVISPVEIDRVPFFITSADRNSARRLAKLAGKISPTVREISDEQRLALHVSAVFVNNFPNFMYTIAEDLCRLSSLDFDWLRPLLQEGAHKIREAMPSDCQTGPARRQDLLTLERHRDFLKNHPSILPVYEAISRELLERYKKK